MKKTMNLEKIQELSYSGSCFDENIMTTYQEHFFSSCPAGLTYERITYSVPQRKKEERKYILDNLSGRINFGEMTAIVGHSGSGKTSLMNILSGHTDFCSNRKQKITGKITMNGKDTDRNLIRKLSTYIMQQDELFPVFTVKETLMLAANLKFSEKVPLNDKKKMIQENLEKVGLNNCQDTKVKNISGGERKRLCIALELINNPLILFLDEPTSGLDSTSCCVIITLLKSLTCAGCTIICTLHQPSSRILESFHQIKILTNGKYIYQGAPHALMPYLSSLNFRCPKYYTPVDFVLGLKNERKGKYLEILLATAKNKESNDFDHNSNGSFSGHHSSNVYVLNQNNILKDYQNVKNIKDYPTCNLTQYRILLIRDMLSSFRNKWLMIYRFLFFALNGILIGTLCFDIGNNANKSIVNIGSLYYIQLYIMTITAMINIFQFPVDRGIIAREQLNNWYRLKNYYFAKITADLPIQILSVIIFCSIYYWMSSQPNELFRYLYFIGISVLTSLTSMTYGLMFGAGASILIAICLASFASTVVFAFSGFLIRFSAIPKFLRWIASVSFLSYSFEGSMIAIYGYNRSKLECKNDDDVCIFSNPTLILNELSITDGDFYLDVYILIANFLIFTIMGCIILQWKMKT